MLEEKAYAKDIEELRAKLGLDRPIYVQYFEWAGARRPRGPRRVAVDAAAGAGGDRPAAADHARAGAVIALAFALLIAIPVGVISAARHDTLADFVARSAAILGLSVPGFWLATLLIVLPAIWWGWRPVGRLRRVLARSRWPHLRQMLLPAGDPRHRGRGRADAPDPRHAAGGAAAGLRAHGVGQGAGRARRRAQARRCATASSRSSRCSAPSCPRSSAAP